MSKEGGGGRVVRGLAAVRVVTPTFNLQPFLRLWPDYVHDSSWADGAGSCAGNVPFLNENRLGAGRRLGPDSPAD